MRERESELEKNGTITKDWLKENNYLKKHRPHATAFSSDKQEE